MDGFTIFLQAIGTLVAVGLGGWGIYSKLSEKIDKAKDAAINAHSISTEIKGDIKNVDTKLDGFSETCKAHRQAFDRRISRNETRLNGVSKRAGNDK